MHNADKDAKINEWMHEDASGLTSYIKTQLFIADDRYKLLNILNNIREFIRKGMIWEGTQRECPTCKEPGIFTLTGLDTQQCINGHQFFQCIHHRTIKGLKNSVKCDCLGDD